MLSDIDPEGSGIVTLKALAERLEEAIQDTDTNNTMAQRAAVAAVDKVAYAVQSTATDVGRWLSQAIQTDPSPEEESKLSTKSFEKR